MVPRCFFLAASDVLCDAGNLGTHSAPSLPARVGTGGQAPFEATNPVRLLDRPDAPFIRPAEPCEFRGRWLLLSGTADCRAGVAVWPPPPRRL